MWKGLFLAGLMVAAGVPGLALEGAPALRHQMQRGQTMAILARVYGVPVEEILAANPGVAPQRIAVGAEIAIPAPSVGWAEVVSPGGLEELCAGFGVLPQEVLQLNPGVQVAAGVTVLVPRSPSALPAAGGLSAGDSSGGPRLPPDNSSSPAGPATQTAAAERGSRETAAVQGWVAVYLPDGSRAWAPRANLIVSSKTPLPPERVIALAQQFEGTPYRWGGQTPNGVDCSGFIQEVYALGGYRLPRLADEQFQDTVPVAQEEARPGDLVFFSTYLPGPSHVGIFLGDGKFLHASSSRGVTVASLQDDYFSARFLGVRRLRPWAASPSASTGP